MKNSKQSKDIFLKKDVTSLVSKDWNNTPKHLKRNSFCVNQKNWSLLGVSESNQTLFTKVGVLKALAAYASDDLLSNVADQVDFSSLGSRQKDPQSLFTLALEKLSPTQLVSSSHSLDLLIAIAKADTVGVVTEACHRIQELKDEVLNLHLQVQGKQWVETTVFYQRSKAQQATISHLQGCNLQQYRQAQVKESSLHLELAALQVRTTKAESEAMILRKERDEARGEQNRLQRRVDKLEKEGFVPFRARQALGKFVQERKQTFGKDPKKDLKTWKAYSLRSLYDKLPLDYRNLVDFHRTNI
jgi:cell division protein FtsB